MSATKRNVIGTILGSLGGLFAGGSVFAQGLLARDGQGFELFLAPLAVLIFVATIASAIAAGNRVRLWLFIAGAALLLPLLTALVSPAWLLVHLGSILAAGAGVGLGSRLAQVSGPR